MRLGIKRKILFVLVGSLVLTTALHALLASYFTNRQNEASAFALLDLDLQGWQNDLQDLTIQLRKAAIAAVSDRVVLDQLVELNALEFSLEDNAGLTSSSETARTLAYLKAVSITRLDLVLRTAGFSSVSVYSRGRLSHHVTATDAGMMIHRSASETEWRSAAADAHGRLPTVSWPTWAAAAPPVATAVPSPDGPRVSFELSAGEGTVIEIAVPVQGVIEAVLTDDDRQPRGRFISDVAVAGTGQRAAARPTAPAGGTAVFAVVVFRRLLGQAELEKVAAKTGKLPALFSPTGEHRHTLTDVGLPPTEVLRTPNAGAPLAGDHRWQGIVNGRGDTYYAALHAWHFEGRPALVLALTTSREPTLQNIRQTVAAILSVAALILLFSLGAAALLVGRLINPVVALTSAVKAIGARGREEGSAGLEGLKPVAIAAPDEVGELTRAFNRMIVELRTTLETLEQRVQARTAELRQQARYLRTLIDTLPMMVWLKDTEGRYLAVNQAQADACSHHPDEIVGKTDRDLWPEGLAERNRAEDQAVMGSRERRTIEGSIPDGSRDTWIEICKAPVVDEDGTVLGTVGAARDISERKAAEAAREAALQEARRLARLRSEFLAQMSHELRTPLNGILGYAQIMQRDESLDRRQRANVSIIRESGEHLLTLIDDVLDLAKVEAGKIELHPSDFALGPFLRSLSDLVRVKAEERKLDFACEAASALPHFIRADQKRLRQVLLNLLSNAIKSTDQGQVTLEVRPGGPGRLRFEVRDTGIGIAEDQLETIFQAFEQAGDPERRMGGAGLGLAISRQFVRLMGGELLVASRLGEGSRFWFEIDTPAVEAGRAEAPEGRIEAYIGPRRSILVIDDIAENRRLVVDMLSPLGFTMHEAENGAQGIERATRLRPDLILTDVFMPELNGLEATRRMRRIPVLADVPIIAMSASASPGDEQSCLSAGMNAFLPKPLDMGRLLGLIGEMLHLQWEHAAVAPDTAAQRTAPGPLVAPPPVELEALHLLVLRGNMRGIIAEASRIAALDRRYHAFSEELRRLAEGFQSKALLKFVERHLREEGLPP